MGLATTGQTPKASDRQASDRQAYPDAETALEQ
jgi:hypothetical protein